MKRSFIRKCSTNLLMISITDTVGKCYPCYLPWLLSWVHWGIKVIYPGFQCCALPWRDRPKQTIVAQTGRNVIGYLKLLCQDAHTVFENDMFKMHIGCMLEKMTFCTLGRFLQNLRYILEKVAPSIPWIRKIANHNKRRYFFSVSNV